MIFIGQALTSRSYLALRHIIADVEERAMLTFAENYVQSENSISDCFFEKGDSSDKIARCVPDNEPSIVVWGDSHAASLANGLGEATLARGLVAGPGCAPLLNHPAADSDWCSLQNNAMLNGLLESPPTTLVLDAYWCYKRDKIRLLPETIATLRSALPSTRIIVIGGMPYWMPSLPERIVADGVLGKLDSKIPAQLEAVLAADEMINVALRAEIASGDVLFIRPTEILCDGNMCPAYAEDVPFAFDYGHLTDVGASKFLSELQAKYPELPVLAAPLPPSFLDSPPQPAYRRP